MFIKKILPIIIFILLLLGMVLFPYIPMVLLKIINVDYNNFNMTLKTLYMLFCDIGYMLILFLIYKDKLTNDFKKYIKNFSSNFETSFKYYFIGALIMVISNLIITLFFSNATAGNEEAVRSLIDQLPLYMIFSVSLYAPFTEELIFRHSIKNVFKNNKKNKISKYIYIFTSGFIFAALHIIGQATSYIDYLYLIPYMSLGIAFAALYQKTDNIASSIIAHSLHNTLTIILYLMAGGIV